MDLKKYLKENGIKINFFAERVGVSENTISRIFKGKEPSLTVAVAIEKATNGQVTCHDLVKKSKTKGE